MAKPNVEVLSERADELFSLIDNSNRVLGLPPSDYAGAFAKSVSNAHIIEQQMGKAFSRRVSGRWLTRYRV